MGVYIRGMEMPTNEGMEPTSVRVYPNGYAVVFKDNGNMQQYTEAVPIPPHGRSIDADALIAWFKEWYDLNADVEVWQIIQMLADEAVAPTIIPAEEAAP